MALRAADDKSKVKDSDLPSPGTVKFTSAPAAVQKTFKDETKNAKIELLGKGIGEDKSAYFKAIVPIGSNDYEMAVAEDGQLLEKLLHPIRTDDLKLEDCPPAVQKSLKEDSKSAKVEGVSRVTAGKRSDFIIDVTIQKTKYQMMFTEDGTLMSKVMDFGADESDAQDAATDKVSEKPEKPQKKAK
jgi:hypothetical protein